MKKKRNKFDSAVFGSRFKAARNRVGITQQDVADALGTHQNIISMYETGEREPSPKVIGDYAHICRVSPDFFYQTMYDMPQEEMYAELENEESGNDGKEVLEFFLVLSECVGAVHEILKNRIEELSEELSENSCNAGGQNES